MNSNMNNYVLTASLLCLASLLGTGNSIATAQNNAKQSQQGTIQDRRATVVAKGVVTDDTQEPLVGVTVRVKGTKVATTTDPTAGSTLPCQPWNPEKPITWSFPTLAWRRRWCAIAAATPCA